MQSILNWQLGGGTQECSPMEFVSKYPRMRKTEPPKRAAVKNQTVTSVRLTFLLNAYIWNRVEKERTAISRILHQEKHASMMSDRQPVTCFCELRATKGRWWDIRVRLKLQLYQCCSSKPGIRLRQTWSKILQEIQHITTRKILQRNMFKWKSCMSIGCSSVEELNEIEKHDSAFTLSCYAHDS